MSEHNTTSRPVLTARHQHYHRAKAVVEASLPAIAADTRMVIFPRITLEPGRMYMAQEGSTWCLPGFEIPIPFGITGAELSERLNTPTIKEAAARIIERLMMLQVVDPAAEFSPENTPEIRAHWYAEATQRAKEILKELFPDYLVE